MRAQLEGLARLVDEEKIHEAKALLASLESRIGPDDPAALRARWELDLMASGEP